MVLDRSGKHTLKIVSRTVEIIIVLAILLAVTAGALDRGVDHIGIQGLQLSGRLEAEGTHFELNDSDYLNITLDSSEPVRLVLESVPEMVSMQINSTSGAVSSLITIGGFLPLTTYHKYEDDYHGHEAFTTDESGSYAYVQDISSAHLIFIQPRPSTKFIRDDATGGNCASIGIWNTSAKTCTLTMDLTETVQIDSNGITLDGSGHNITGSKTGNGVYLSGRSRVAIRNLNVRNFGIGIFLYNSSNNNLTGNTASNNGGGISLGSSNNNILTGDTASNNGLEGIFLGSSNNNTLTGNNASNNDNGILLSSSSSNNLAGNTANLNKYYGISLGSSSNNNLTGNTANSNNKYGIHLQDTSNNNLTGNTALNNEVGINLPHSTKNNLLGNIVNSNHFAGIDLAYSSNNTLIGNNALNNHHGITLYGSSNNNLTGNTALNNYFGISVHSSSNNDLAGNTANSNNYTGIFVYCCHGYDNNTNTSNNNNLAGNTANLNKYYGISLSSSSNNNNLTGNTANLNKYYGISLSSSSNNTIYNNYFNNTNNSYFAGSIYGNLWNTTKTAGMNIIGGPYLGGNFWAHPNDTGFSQTCADSDSDGICDSEYVLTSWNIDHLPLAEAGGEPPVALCGPDKLRCENAGAPVHFNASASSDPDGTIVSYYWEFGDGTNGTGMAPNHIYAIYRWNGTAYLPFIVNLTVTDDSGLTNRTSQKVVIWEAGDTNGDANVNILDASLVGLKWKGNEPCADLNNDGKVNIVDASIIGLNWGSVQACRSNLYCSPGSYCEKKTGNCAGNGTCQKMPDSCTDLYDPVCGCNGITYSNACYAAANGVSVAYEGECY